ncbi:PLP-dependent aminotransferase family protein [uncultured Chitinophaga sp.]|uniref:MocR-like pyridoxine biosynthesis transcription factor PdxR n=1 Tax=uncultured Chitinophaga sp. TaxID=339340 RepID=UPI0025F92529|nr:PLP-dependent aminotransferase family protein [uncultured Chitinophaga sp.]
MGQKLRPWKTILPIEIASGKAVFVQIAEGIASEIKRGRLQPGDSLPGSRVLADDLGVNRKTVVLAYEDLIAEGWLSTAYKRGTFVSEQLPKIKRAVEQPVKKASFDFYAFKAAGDRQQTPAGANLIYFNDGLPDVRLAPLDELARAYKRIFQQKARWRMMGYSQEKGDDRLRKALAQMLVHDRGLSTTAEEICVTRGSQMALYLTAHTLVKPGDRIAIETPGYLPAHETFKRAGADVVPVKIDEEGICLEALEKTVKEGAIRAVYVTPHHQFPTTVTMNAARRLELVALSNKYNFAIIEDDYDHEYHFGQRSFLPLASHENAGNVIYISSLSKLVAPSVRIGYIAGPRSFIDSVAALRLIIDRQGDSVMENAVAELMEEGSITKHARKAWNIYKNRRDLMETLLIKHLSGIASFTKPEGGLAFWLKFHQEIDTRELAERLDKQGVAVIPTECFSFNGERLNALRLGYGSLNEKELAEGIAALASVLKS